MVVKQRDILRRLMTALGVKSQGQLSLSLGIKPQSIVSALKRGKVPDAWLYRVAYMSGRRVEWLRTGQGAVWQEGIVTAGAVAEGNGPEYMTGRDRSKDMDALLSLCRELDDREREAVRRYAEALNIGGREIREHLIGQMTLIGEAIRRQNPKRKQPRPGRRR